MADKAPIPTHKLYHVVGEAEFASWTEIGSAGPKRTDLVLSFTRTDLPDDGRIVLRALPGHPG